jgi:uncharacterized delta-60 repeat protein
MSRTNSLQINVLWFLRVVALTSAILSLGIATKAAAATPSLDSGGRIALLADGGVITLSVHGCGKEIHCSGTLHRFTPDGKQDSDFGAGGSVVLGLDDPGAIALDSSDRIIVAGSARGAGEKFAVARYTPTGVLDPTFGTGGVSFIEMSGITDSRAWSLAVGAKDEILAGGALDGGSAVVELLPDGSPNASFGAGGIFLAGAGGPVVSLMVQRDGMILGTLTEARYVRLMSDGSLDHSVGSNGFFGHSSDPESFLSLPVTILSPGEGVIGLGSGGPPSCLAPVASKLSTTGAPDPSWSRNLGSLAAPKGCHDGNHIGGEIKAAMLQGDRVVVAGSRPRAAMIARLLPDGGIDTSFAKDGSFFVRPAGLETELNGAVPTLDGGFLLDLELGNAHCPVRECSAEAVVKVDSEGRLDRTFGGIGFVSTPRIHLCPRIPFLSCGIDLGRPTLKSLTASRVPRRARLTRADSLSLALGCHRRVETRCGYTVNAYGRSRGRPRVRLSRPRSFSVAAGHRRRILLPPLPGLEFPSKVLSIKLGVAADGARGVVTKEVKIVPRGRR